MGPPTAPWLQSPAIRNEGRVRLFSSVYRQYLTIHKAGEFGGKEHHGIRDVLRGTQALHGDPFHQSCLTFLSVPSPLPLRGRVGTDEARRHHTVYGNPEGRAKVAFGGKKSDSCRRGLSGGLWARLGDLRQVVRQRARCADSSRSSDERNRWDWPIAVIRRRYADRLDRQPIVTARITV